MPGTYKPFRPAYEKKIPEGRRSPTKAQTTRFTWDNPNVSWGALPSKALKDRLDADRAEKRQV